MAVDSPKPDDSPVSKPIKWPVENWDRYQFSAFIGEGSMGRVYKAYDPRLKRYVALKFLRDDDPDSAERLLQEAQAQARIEHDNVCKIFEVGEVDGNPYIAMQYIEGSTLKDAYRSLSLEQQVRLILSVCHGVHEAHRLGLIHRDIKPTNILLEHKDGSYKSYILDFGLVREIEGEGLTMTGEILGTPSYMAPEQALGHTRRIDRRTDVYSLGATLYEIISGTRLYQGATNVDVLLKLLQEEPTTLRKVDRNVPKDLNTVVMKCLEREPARRYDSARDLADDLQRFLDGEPIHARPAGMLYRASKKLKKHRMVALFGVAALLIVVLAGLFGWNARRTAAEQARIAQQFGQDIESIEAILRYAHMLPLHNISNEKLEIHKIMNGIQAEMDGLGEHGYGPGNYALARGYFALQQFTDAKNFLDRARQSGYQTPEVASLMGRTLGELYQKELEDAEKAEGKEMREARKKKAAREYRDPALDFLRQGSSAKFETGAFGRGVIALYEKHFEEALAFARAALQQTSWYYEAKKLEGDIYMQLARQDSVKNQYEARLADYEKAGAAYGSALQMARSDPALYLAECMRWLDIINMKQRWKWGEALDLEFHNASAACQNAIIADPGNSDAYRHLSRVEVSIASRKLDSGGDPVPDLKKAIEAGQRAVEVNPKNARAYLYLGDALWLKARYESSISLETTKTIAEAIDVLKQSAALDPGDPGSYVLIGNMYYTQADRDFSGGKNPGPNLDQAIAVYKEAVKREDLRNPVNNIGSAYMTKGDYEYQSGVDPLPSLNSAIQYFKLAYRDNWQFPVAHLNAAWAYRLMAQYAIENGADPSNYLGRAREELKIAFDQSPKSFNLALEKSRCELAAARWAVKNGSDPALFFQESENYVRKSIELNPENADAYLTLAQLHSWKAQWRFADKPFAGKEVDSGLEAAAKALSIRPDFAEVMATQARLYFMKTRIKPGDALTLQKNQQLLKKALELNPLLTREYASDLNSRSSSVKRKR